jgi:hypothetical protein
LSIETNSKNNKKAIAHNNNIHKQMKGSSYILPKGVLATKDIILMVIILLMNGERETKRSRQKEVEATLTLHRTDSAVRWYKN